MILKSASRAPVLAEATAMLVATRIVVWASPRSGAAKLVEQAGISKRSHGPGRGAVEAAAHVARAIDRAELWSGRTSCLTRALAGWLMLRRRGVPALVRVGAQARAPGDVRMHAWLEVGGKVVIGHEEAAVFVPLSGR